MNVAIILAGGVGTRVGANIPKQYIKILDKQTGEYLPIQLDGYYTIAGFNYFLLEYGSGMSMFKDAQILDAEGTLDVEVLENYIVNVLGGIIDERYATVETRLTFTDGYIS